MNFTAIGFWVFFAIVFLASWLLPRKLRLSFLLLSSYLYYALWNWHYLGVLAASTLITFVCGALIARAKSSRSRRLWLTASLTGCLLILAYYKYLAFVTASLSASLQLLGFAPVAAIPSSLMPLGISYFTFQSLTYTLDIYRGQLTPTRSPIRFAAFVSFFPHIVAGPITRARELLPQLEMASRPSLQDVETGFNRFLVGLFKKVFIADTLAQSLVDPVFANPQLHSSGAHLLALFGYSIQIYADFSGYSSMAIGIARILGFRLPENFRFPYLAVSIAEFWRRWHITLSRWLREYLWWSLVKKIPLGGGRWNRFRSHLSLLFVFLVCGLWHGPTWSFVAWGALHGTYIVVYDAWRSGRPQAGPEEGGSTKWIPTLLSWLLTQSAVLLSWLLFRASNIQVFLEFLRAFVAAPGTLPVPLTPLVWLAFLAFLLDHAIGWLQEHRPRIKQRVPVVVKAIAYVLLILLLFRVRPEHASPFIYFQF